MKSLRLQPMQKFSVPAKPDVVMQRFRESLPLLESAENTSMAGRVVDFRIAPSKQRFWSPHLSVQVGEPAGVWSGGTQEGEANAEEEMSEIIARFSPRPEIWTMVMAIYFAAAICMLAASIFAYAQWFLGRMPWALFAWPAGLLIIGALHGASLVGQSLSEDQMEELQGRLEQLIALAFPAES